MNETYAECLRLVETADRDRAISLAFVPADRRNAIAALYAFNIETARVRDSVSEPMPGEIRLQWWRDALAAPDQGAAGHPVAAALADTIERHELPRAAFDRLLEARIFDLYDDPMPSSEALEAYAGETASTLIMVAAMVLSREEAETQADAAGHAGVAQTIAGVLRLLPQHRARRQVFVPADILSAAGCSAEELIRGEREPAGRAIAAMAAFGRQHVGAWAPGIGTIPKALRPAFLPAAFASRYLDRIARDGAATLDRPAEIGPLRKAYIAWRTMRR
ncbi:phytoene/squalene synthase family protein [Aurantimonas sp. A2-1-M11]|uniref:phytoene/squalene synthase family protein n=1 Tax=Aurantimonas sp. A2-1-M11 TaxID=3113712 RepID=UPI003FA55587